MGFSRQEHWSGLPCPPPGDLPNPGIEPTSLRLLHGRQILYCLNHQGSPSLHTNIKLFLYPLYCWQIDSLCRYFIRFLLIFFFFFFWIELLQWWGYLFSCSAVSDSLWVHGLQHSRLPCPSLTPRACSNSCLSSRWCHPIISSSVVPFCSCSQSFPASGSFQMSQFFALGGQSIGVSASASVPPMNIQDWSLVGKLSSHKHQGRGKKQMKERNNNNNSNTFTWKLDGELYGGGIGLVLREHLRL